jgi:hypothetical protein
MGGGHFVYAAVESGLPFGKRLVEIKVAVNAFGDTDAAECREFVVEVLAEFAEVLVAGVAEREDSVGEFSAAGEMLEAELLVEGPDGIWCVAVAVRAGDEDGVTLCNKCCGGVALKRDE